MPPVGSLQEAVELRENREVASPFSFLALQLPLDVAGIPWVLGAQHGVGAQETLEWDPLPFEEGRNYCLKCVSKATDTTRKVILMSLFLGHPFLYP